MSTYKKALDVLVSSLNKGAEGGNGEWELLGSALQSSGYQSHNADDIFSLLKKAQSQENCLLPILEDVILYSSVKQLRESSHKWVEYLTQQLQIASNAATVQSACKCISTLLNRCHDIPKGMSDFTSRQLPTIVTSLLCFSAANASLQCTVLPVLSKCVVYYPKPCSQFKAHLTKWANAGLFLSCQELSRECSRLLVLVHTQESCSLMVCMCEQLHAVLSLLYGQDSQIPSETIEIPSHSVEEPNRSAQLLRVVCVLSRTLCYCLLFATTLVPLESVLGVAVGGLQKKQQQVIGFSYDKLMLRSVLPTIHTALFNILSTLMRTCHSHLLPYTTTIEACIVQSMSVDNESEALLMSVHRCVCAWVSLRRDIDNYFITLVSSSLLKTADSADSVPLSVQLSALDTLSVIVRSVGVLLPSQVSEPLRKLAVKGFSLSTSPQRALAVLDLLLATVTSSNVQLQTSLGSALKQFNMGARHQSEKVREFCIRGLSQCRLIQHPVVPPLLSPGPSEPPTSHPQNSFLSWQSASLFTAPPRPTTVTPPPSTPCIEQQQSSVAAIPTPQNLATVSPPPSIPSVEGPSVAAITTPLSSTPPLFVRSDVISTLTGTLGGSMAPSTPSIEQPSVALTAPTSQTLTTFPSKSPESTPAFSKTPKQTSPISMPSLEQPTSVPVQSAEEPMDIHSAADHAHPVTDHTHSITLSTSPAAASPPEHDHIVLPEIVNIEEKPTLTTVSDDEDLALFVPASPDSDM